MEQDRVINLEWLLSATRRMAWELAEKAAVQNTLADKLPEGISKAMYIAWAIANRDCANTLAIITNVADDTSRFEVSD